MSTTKVTGMMQTSTKGGDITSASPCVIDTDGDYFDIAGTVSFAVFTVVAGRRFTVQFDGILTMTHHATTLDLPGAANITTAAGDVAEFFATGTNTVQCVSYTRADGTAVVSSAGGDRRNFIIDGDFTQHPDGDSTDAAIYKSGPALWRNQHVGGELVFDIKQTADAPTVGESSHSSTYCLHYDITTAESAVAAGDYFGTQYVITAHDFSHLHQQEVTMSFWHKHTKTGIYSVALRNSAADRSYIFEYTQSSTNTWERHTETFTLDTSGTWLIAGTGIGVQIWFSIYMGSTYTTSADSWTAGNKLASTNQVTGADSTSNNFKIAQVGLYLGSSAPTFLGEPVSTVKSQVEYYVERIDGTVSQENFGITGHQVTTTAHLFAWGYKTGKRVTPTVTGSDKATFRIVSGNSAITCSAGSLVSTAGGPFGVRLDFITSATGTAGNGVGLIRDVTDVTFLMADARH